MEKKKIIQSIKIIVLGLILNLGMSYVFAVAVSPLNVGISNQAKAGGLAVGTATWPQYLVAVGGHGGLDAYEPSTAKLEVSGVTSTDALSVWYNSTLLGNVGIGGLYTTDNKLTVSGNTKVIGSMIVDNLAHTPPAYFGKSPLCATAAGVLKVCDLVTLTVNKTGTGTGLVTASAVGWGMFSCGADCSRSYFVNTHVELSATADSGSTFAGTSYYSGSGTGTSGWTGCDSTINYGSICIINKMNTSKVVTANFNVPTAPTCGSSGSKTFTFPPSSQSFTVPQYCTVTAHVWGAGGGGGGGHRYGTGGSGGGGGGGARADGTFVSDGQLFYVVVGTGGTGGPGGDSDNNLGEDGTDGDYSQIKNIHADGGTHGDGASATAGGPGGTGGYSGNEQGHSGNSGSDSGNDAGGAGGNSAGGGGGCGMGVSSSCGYVGPGGTCGTDSNIFDHGFGGNQNCNGGNIHGSYYGGGGAGGSDGGGTGGGGAPGLVKISWQ